MNLTPCKACGAPVIFVRMPSGHLNPLDAEPVAKGNVIVTERDGEVHGEMLTALEAAAHEGPLYLSHYASCPEAKKFRKAKK